MWSDKVAKREGRREGGYRAVCKGGVWGRVCTVWCVPSVGGMCARARGVCTGAGAASTSVCLSARRL